MTGSDSAPAKANETGQKNDIGAAKDDISLTVVNAKMQGMETAYVGNGVSASEASTTVGTEVIKAVAQKYQTNNKIGKATIEIDGFGTIENVERDATVSVYTTDFVVEGTITLNGGVLTWGKIENNVPGIKITDVPSALGKNATTTLGIKRKDISNSANVTWESLNTGIATINSSTGEVTGVAAGTATIRASVTESGTTYTAECSIKVEIMLPLWNGTKRDIILSTTQPIELTDNKGNKIYIPANFKISKDNADNGTAGNNVDEGTIIEDANGNQFVWVPVGTITRSDNKSVTIPLGRYSDFTATSTAENGVKTYTPAQVQNASNKEYTPTATTQTAINTYYYEFKDDDESKAVKNNATYDNTKAKELDKFVKSTLTNGGFYIARYEAGIEGTTDYWTLAGFQKNSTTNLNESTIEENVISTNGSVKPIIKNGQGVWNAVTQPQAATICRNMYTSGVKSDLMNSYAWDTAIIFIQQCSDKTTYANATRLVTGLYTTGNAHSGTTYDNPCNIYDMAGNVREWTTECSTRLYKRRVFSLR